MTAFAPARLPLTSTDANFNIEHGVDEDGFRQRGIALDYDYLRTLVVGKAKRGVYHQQTQQRVFCVSLPGLKGATGVDGYRSLTEPALRLEKMAPVVEESVVVTDTAPSSPPGLSYSKSSKSSDSEHTDGSSIDGSTDKLAHYDDVTLDEDRESVEECNVKPESRPTLRRPPKRASSHTYEGTGQASPPMPHEMQGAVNGVPRDQSLNLPFGRGIRRGFTSPSSPSLVMGRHQVDSRSPSPNKTPTTNGYANSPQTVSVLSPRSSWSAPSPNPSVPLSRRQSWQPRKTAKQLEAEYDDGDEDVPEEAILENVPITGLDGHVLAAPIVTPRLKTPSPHRRPSHNNLHAQHSNLHSANVPKNAKRPSAPTIMPNGQYGAPRSPRHGRPPMMPHSATAAAYPGERLSHKHRSKSWTDDLNAEAQQLSAALAEYADRTSTEKRHSGSGSNTAPSSPPRPSLTKARAKSAILELPSVQKGNVMIDPLPCSKEKEAVLSRTRPSWLPPKSQKEEKRHIKQWEQMMARAAEAEKKRVVREQEQAEDNEERRSSISRLWEEHVLPNWDAVVAEPRTRELWWRGVTPKSRAAVWRRAIGNELQLSQGSFEAALRRAGETEERIAEMPEEERSKSIEAAWFEAVERDAPNVFPELEVFERGTPVHQALVDVLKAYAMYRNDVGYVYGTHLIAGVLCLHMRAPEAFVVLANLLNRPLPLAFLVHDRSAMSQAYNLVLSTLKYKCTKLHSHLTSSALNIQPEDYLDPIFRCLFAYNLPPEHVSRVWDIFAFEGDKALIRAAVAVLSKLESKLYGSKEEILDVVGWHNEKHWDIGTEEEFIAAVRDAGKADAKGGVTSA